MWNLIISEKKYSKNDERQLQIGLVKLWHRNSKLVVKENWWFLLEVSTSYQINNTQLLLISCVECEKQTFSKPLMTVNED